MAEQGLCLDMRPKWEDLRSTCSLASREAAQANMSQGPSSSQETAGTMMGLPAFSGNLGPWTLHEELAEFSTAPD